MCETGKIKGLFFIYLFFFYPAKSRLICAPARFCKRVKNQVGDKVYSVATPPTQKKESSTHNIIAHISTRISYFPFVCDTTLSRVRYASLSLSLSHLSPDILHTHTHTDTCQHTSGVCLQPCLLKSTKCPLRRGSSSPSSPPHPPRSRW